MKGLYQALANQIELIRHYKSRLDEAHQKNGIVTKCWEPECSLKRLDVWDKKVWMPYPTNKDHEKYSDGICPAHLKLEYAKIGKTPPE